MKAGIDPGKKILGANQEREYRHWFENGIESVATLNKRQWFTRSIGNLTEITFTYAPVAAAKPSGIPIKTSEKPIVFK